MHPLQTMKQNRIDRFLENDQKSIDFIEKIDLEDMIAAIDVSFARNQYGDMHIGEVFKDHLKITLWHSEKTRHGIFGGFNAIDMVFAFGRVEVLDDQPRNGLKLIVLRDGVPMVVQYKSSPIWANHDSNQQFLENATAWLDEYYPGEGEIVLCSDNGDSDSTARPPLMFAGRLVRRLYGTACAEFLTGNANPAELIDHQVFDALVAQRRVAPYQRNAHLIDRKVMELLCDLVQADNCLHGFLLMDEHGCPLWNNWRQAKERISPKKERKDAAKAA
jgi:hypothetical protein